MPPTGPLKRGCPAEEASIVKGMDQPGHEHPEAAQAPPGLGPPEDLKAPAELSEDLREEIRTHLAEHGIELKVERDVSWQEHVPQGALIEAWFASPSGAAGFYCAKCQRTTIVGEPLHGPLRTSMLLRKNPELAALLKGADPDQLDSLVRAWERGELAPAINETRLRQASQRNRGMRRRDSNTRRREACQRLMLRRFAEIGHTPTVFNELHEVLRENRGLCIKLTGFEAPPSVETLRKYWSGHENSIPQAERNAAEAAFLARPEAERKQIEKERRLGELRPPDYLTP